MPRRQRQTWAHREWSFQSLIAVTTREHQGRPCADKARRLRMAQCRAGWHLESEPAIQRTKPGDEQQELMAARADLFTAYAECKANDDAETCEQIADSVTELDAILRA